MSEAGSRYDFVYVHTNIPEGMTLRQWRGRSGIRARSDTRVRLSGAHG